MIETTVIADSLSPTGSRLTTIEMTMPRFILAEFNTHRLFSRNSASSRAIPVAKQIARVAQDPVLPAAWRYNQAGMQAYNDMTPEDAAKAEGYWRMAASNAAIFAELFTNIGPNDEKGKPLGLHKQWANRVLEPFMWHTVICTSSEWFNFLEQRDSPLAQPEIEVLAKLVSDALLTSHSNPVEYGEWHLPYIWQEDRDEHNVEDLKKMSVARCARVSTLAQDGRKSFGADIALYDRLTTAIPPHWSPLEHVATPFKNTLWGKFRGRRPLGNFYGWSQLRHLLGR